MRVLRMMGMVVVATLAMGMPTVACDAAVNWQLGFQDPASPFAEGIVKFHHDLMVILVGVVVLVGYMLWQAMFQWNSDVKGNVDGVVHGATIEFLWTTIPARILASVALPSFGLLFSMEEVVTPSVTVKVVGHQWYWSYELSDVVNEDGETVEFDSYMVGAEDIEDGQLRLLEVDRELLVPIRTHVRVLVTAADVLHAFAVPSLGLKVDACPGRMNQIHLYASRPGVFKGQCSELCGVNHGFMPISVVGVSMEEYCAWVDSRFDE